MLQSMGSQGVGHDWMTEKQHQLNRYFREELKQRIRRQACLGKAGSYSVTGLPLWLRW